jgi:peptidyl-dipeptidase Dcp
LGREINQMAQKPEVAMNLLAQIATPAVAAAKLEAAEIQKLIDAQKGGFKLEPWDWNFYAEPLFYTVILITIIYFI